MSVDLTIHDVTDIKAEVGEGTHATWIELTIVTRDEKFAMTCYFDNREVAETYARAINVTRLEFV